MASLKKDISTLPKEDIIILAGQEKRSGRRSPEAVDAADGDNSRITLRSCRISSQERMKGVKNQLDKGIDSVAYRQEGDRKLSRGSKLVTCRLMLSSDYQWPILTVEDNRQVLGFKRI